MKLLRDSRPSDSGRLGTLEGRDYFSIAPPSAIVFKLGWVNEFAVVSQRLYVYRR
ncbi:hypothetical protein M407DRAFT_243425 [Tulasnella calospora MUT 4182]|uniref:Uncharacterized protein n=1 Tax=Tulasnella calospora MUT 4182 TaxID=1051891 RepID=A0A0C3L0F4_9AGAM|nr:hypothetical protein M407DRAFT_243425 [Tulasnella calospora MUT 4182]